MTNRKLFTQSGGVAPVLLAVAVLAAAGFYVWQYVINAPKAGPNLVAPTCGGETVPAGLQPGVEAMTAGEPAMPENVAKDLRRALGTMPPQLLRLAYAAGVTVRVVPQAAVPPGCRGEIESQRAAAAGESPGKVVACVAFAAASGDAIKPILYLGVNGGEPVQPAAKTAEEPFDFLHSAIAQAVVPVLSGFVLDQLVPALRAKYPPPEAAEVDVEGALWAARFSLASKLAADDPAAEGLAYQYGVAWAQRPDALNRLALAATAAFYCSEATRAKFADLHPGVAVEFERGMSCLLGKPWYAAEEKFATACHAKS